MARSLLNALLIAALLSAWGCSDTQSQGADAVEDDSTPNNVDDTQMDAGDEEEERDTQDDAAPPPEEDAASPADVVEDDAEPSDAEVEGGDTDDQDIDGVDVDDEAQEDAPPPPDRDGDGVPDDRDRCPDDRDPEQSDVDVDGIGDVCDNCPEAFNPDQRDDDDNGVGDFCEDRDEDGFTGRDGDCDDDDPLAFPGNEEVSSFRDYDCDGRIDYEAEIRLIVDDAYPALCVNGATIAGVCVEQTDCESDDQRVISSWSDQRSERYQVVLHGGPNVIGLHGQDLGGVISGAQILVRVAGMDVPSEGIIGDDPDVTPWRYDPMPETSGKDGWCGPNFDDADWPAATRAGEWGDNVWLQSPVDLQGVGTEWIWDETPRGLADSYFRLNLTLPREPGPVTELQQEGSCALIGEPRVLEARRAEDVAFAATPDGVAAALSSNCCGFRTGASELFLSHGTDADALVATHTRITDASWWSTSPSLVTLGQDLMIAWADGRDNRTWDRVYVQRFDTQRQAIGNPTPVSTGRWSKAPVIAAQGAQALILWQQGVGVDELSTDLMARPINADGAFLGPARFVRPAPGLSRKPELSAHGDGFLTVWEDTRDGEHGIYATRLDINGDAIGELLRLDAADPLARARRPALAAGDGLHAVVWEDTRDGNSEIYFATIDAQGQASSPLRLTQDRHRSQEPTLTWDGEAFLVLFTDNRSSADNITLLRVSPSGERLEGPLLMTGSAAQSNDAALIPNGVDEQGRRRFLVAWEETDTELETPYFYTGALIADMICE